MSTIEKQDIVLINEIVEEILEKYRPALGKIFESYRSHVYRVLNYCILNVKQKSTVNSDIVEKIAIASVFHDIGIWSENAWDYLKPSIKIAKEYLSERNKTHWVDEISLMIDMHHKLKPYNGPHRLIVESFRRADLMDIPGKSIFGILKNHIQTIKDVFPDASFKKVIYKRIAWEFIKKPWNPLPMVKL